MKRESDHFTDELQEISLYVDEILQRYSHNQIDTEHILLALIEKSQKIISPLLKTLNANTQSLVDQLTDVLSRSPRAGAIKEAQIYITPRTKRIFQLANEIAIKLKGQKVSSEHFLIAILTERNTPAAHILASVGLTYNSVYSAIQELHKKQDGSIEKQVI